MSERDDERAGLSEAEVGMLLSSCFHALGTHRLSGRTDELERRLAEAGARILNNRMAAIWALAETWRYKGEFGWGAWQEGEGPDPEGYVLDRAAAALRAALTTPAPTSGAHESDGGGL